MRFIDERREEIERLRNREKDFFLADDRTEGIGLWLSNGLAFFLAHDEREALLSLMMPRDHGDPYSSVYWRRPGHKPRHVFTSAYGWVVKSGALSPKLALIAGGPDGLVLIDRGSGRRIQNRACTSQVSVSSVAIAGERVFVGTKKGLLEVPLRGLETLARRRSRKRN